ncbi:hypothetical protein CLV31_1095 [Algoriphagus aquaeductus]|uniref:Uncharacterized protein n=1 Tax=Algoriphagus aquaeductus TaxID=475299 RepID=A0A326RW89_9BACT|nr:hypothetical protein [Algoriphagus aquaeductus]PZV82145.1 hypothetical protein CLV31_1095 [Algoriphagus aquaeductus]
MRSKPDIIEPYLKKLDEKNFDLSHVRKALEEKDYPEEEIKAIIKILDNELQQRAFEKLNNATRFNLMGLGLTLTGIGILVTFGTFLGFIPSGNSFILAYGPILGGISLSVSAYFSKKKNGGREGKFRNQGRKN